MGRHSKDADDEPRRLLPDAAPNRYFPTPLRPLTGPRSAQVYARRARRGHLERLRTFGPAGAPLLVGLGVTLQSLRAPTGGAHRIGATLAVLGTLISLAARSRSVRSVAIAMAILCLLNSAASGRRPIDPDQMAANIGSSDSALVRLPVVHAVEPSVVKIRGDATGECGRWIEGSGFVYAAGRVITNAHVVAGTRSVTVESTQGTSPPGNRGQVNEDLVVHKVCGLVAS